MAHDTTQPKRPRPGTSDRALTEQLRRARQALEALQDEADNTGGWSVEHCSRMAKFWLATFLQADREYRGAKDGGSKAAAWSRVTKASSEAGEWEKRKSTALIGLKVDLLAKVLAKLEEQDAIASELMEIEE